tara:strand:- start:472 stop:786 length:315 start_codon:yes stop_codon:yes gene_type:complete
MLIISITSAKVKIKFLLSLNIGQLLRDCYMEGEKKINGVVGCVKRLGLIQVRNREEEFKDATIFRFFPGLTFTSATCYATLLRSSIRIVFDVDPIMLLCSLFIS